VTGALIVVVVVLEVSVGDKVVVVDVDKTVVELDGMAVVLSEDELQLFPPQLTENKKIQCVCILYAYAYKANRGV
jgi:hypothetical protein